MTVQSPAAPLPRRRTRCVCIGRLRVGAEAPVAVQSMTNTDTADVAATVTQVAELARAGSELVRITVNNEAAARAVPQVRERLARQGVDVPLAGDFHYNGHALLAKYPACAEVLDKLRINPGNVGAGARPDHGLGRKGELAAVERCAKERVVRDGDASSEPAPQRPGGR